MKAYLKNGQTVKINQKIANEIVDMKIKGNSNTIVTRNVFSDNVFAYLDVDEIIAIR